jgi:uncharacterized protein
VKKRGAIRPAIRPAINDKGDGVTFAVRVSPRAGRTQFTGMMGEGADAVVKIALAAPPVEGRANEALIAYLADVLDVPRATVEILAGQQSRNKVVRVRGRSAVQIANAFRTDKKPQLP